MDASGTRDVDEELTVRGSVAASGIAIGGRRLGSLVTNRAYRVLHPSVHIHRVTLQLNLQSSSPLDRRTLR